MSRDANLAAPLRTFILVLALAAAAPAHALVLSRNGNFDQGADGFTDWSRVIQPGSSGNWFQLTDGATPITAVPLPPPPGGGSAAVTDFFGPGTVVLSQAFDAPPASQGTLSFSLYYANYADQWYQRSDLDFTDRPNQQLRIDLMRDGSNPLSVAAEDVLQPILRTQPGDPLTLPWTSFVFDIAPALLGPSTRFYLREAATATDDFFVVATTHHQFEVLLIPEPSAFALLAAGLGVMAFVVAKNRRSRRRRGRD